MQGIGIRKPAVGVFLALIVWHLAGVVPASATDFASWAATPPMGWNSWDAYGQSVTEAEVRANTDFMATNLKDYGWEYAVIDIRWTAQNPTYIYNPDAVFTMDQNGRLIPAPNRFPSSVNGQGFKPLADYIHSQGLKFGIHIMRGMPLAAYDTPAEYPNGYPIAGSTYFTKDVPVTPPPGDSWLPDMYGIGKSAAGQAYYNSIFQQYAGWGVDYVKVDDVVEGSTYFSDEVEMIRSAIDSTGRPIVFNAASPGIPFRDDAINHVTQYANQWRISGDIWDKWSIIRGYFDQLDRWTPYRSSGHWPDFDMLPLGRIGIKSQVGYDRMTHLNANEQRTVMTLSVIARSPLMFGGDLPSNDAATTALLTNREVLNVDQRSSNNRQLFRTGDQNAWVADAPGGGKYLALFNAPAVDEFSLLTSRAAFRSPIITRNTPGQSVSFNVDVTGKTHLYLVADDGGDSISWDWGDWVNMELHGPSGSLQLSSLPWVRATTGYSSAAVGQNVNGNPLTINGTTYANGIGTHAASIIEFMLPEGYTSLTGIAGIDQVAALQTHDDPSIQFFIAASNGELSDSSQQISVNLADLGFTGDVTIRDLWSHTTLGSFQGTFSPAIGWHGAGLYRLIQSPNLAGDYNRDGHVDGADYVVWRNSLGSIDDLAADGDGNFVIDQNDFEIWRSHFGQQLESPGGASTLVPEPSGALMLVLMTILVQSSRLGLGLRTMSPRSGI